MEDMNNRWVISKRKFTGKCQNWLMYYSYTEATDVERRVVWVEVSLVDQN